MNVDNEPKPTNYLLNREASGGLGKIFVDVLPDETIQLSSNTVLNQIFSIEHQLAARATYLAVVIKKEDGDTLGLERSMRGGNDDFKNPAVNRPSMADIKYAIMQGHDNTGARMTEDQLEEIFNRINNVFSRSSASTEQ